MIPGIVAGGLLAGDSAGSDPYWSFVKVLLYGEGADGSALFTDHSPVGRTLTANGNAQQDTGVDVMGQSILLDGVGDYVSAASSADLQVGTSTDFCFEAYIRTTDLSHTNTISNKRSGSSAQEHNFAIVSDGSVQLATFGSGVARLVCQSAPGLVAINTVLHIAGSREGTTGRVFIGGNQVATAVQSGTVTTNTSTLKIGRDGFNTSRDFEGNLNWYRFTLGHPRYVGNFTPPPPPFPQF